MTAGTIALVETATQLLNAAEWAHGCSETRRLRIDVLAPTDWQSVRQLNGVADLVRDSGIEVMLRPVRARGPRRASAVAAVLADVVRAERLVIGDPFSGVVQTLLPAARTSRFDIVDDGTATWDYAQRIDRGEPLVRWNRSTSSPRKCSVRATRLLSPSKKRQIDVFSSLSQATPYGAVSLINRYRWTRSMFVPTVVPEQVDVLGTSLVDTGVVDRDAYLGAVAGLAGTAESMRYLAHRREGEDLVGQIAAIPNVRVERHELPAELALRAGPVAANVIVFPSTAAHTLPVVLSDVDVQLRVHAIESDWFTPQASERARCFVARIAADAPATPYV